MDVHNTQLHRSLQGKWYTQTESTSRKAEGKPGKDMKDVVQTKDTKHLCTPPLPPHCPFLKDHYFNNHESADELPRNLGVACR